jgi:hypothetical protein
MNWTTELRLDWGENPTSPITIRDGQRLVCTLLDWDDAELICRAVNELKERETANHWLSQTQ